MRLFDYSIILEEAYVSWMFVFQNFNVQRPFRVNVSIVWTFESVSELTKLMNVIVKWIWCIFNLRIFLFHYLIWSNLNSKFHEKINSHRSKVCNYFSNFNQFEFNPINISKVIIIILHKIFISLLSFSIIFIIDEIFE